MRCYCHLILMALVLAVLTPHMANGKVCLIPCNLGYVGIYDGLFGPVATGTLLHPALNKF